MSKLPSERIDEIFNSTWKINDTEMRIQVLFDSIIKYLDEQYEQQKTISHDELDAILLERANGTFSKHQQLCIRGGNFACACESCNEKFIENLDKL